MNKKHAIRISLAAGLAAVAGTVAATKTVQLGHAGAAAHASSAVVTQRTAALNRVELALHKALARKPPKLPSLPASTSAQPPRVVYVRPAPHVVTIHRPGHGEHDGNNFEAESGRERGFDD